MSTAIRCHFSLLIIHITFTMHIHISLHVHTKEKGTGSVCNTGQSVCLCTVKYPDERTTFTSPTHRPPELLKQATKHPIFVALMDF